MTEAAAQVGALISYCHLRQKQGYTSITYVALLDRLEALRDSLNNLES